MLDEQELSVSKLCDRWVQQNQFKWKEGTYIKYHHHIEAYIKQKLGGLFVSDVNRAELSAFTSYLHNQLGLSAKTTKDVLVLLRTILQSYCVNEGGTWSPFRFVFPRLPSEPLRVLNETEHKTLLQYVKKDLRGTNLAIYLALVTGVRLGEVCGLKWENVSFEYETLSIVCTVYRVPDREGVRCTKTRLVCGNPKSPSSMRVIPLTSSTMRELRRIYQNQSDHYIISESCSIPEPRRVQREMKEILYRLQIPDVHFHTLRHTFGTRMIELGCDAKSLSNIMGHASVNITLNTYVHPSMKAKRSNITKLENAQYC